MNCFNFPRLSAAIATVPAANTATAAKAAANIARNHMSQATARPTLMLPPPPPTTTPTT